MIQAHSGTAPDRPRLLACGRFILALACAGSPATAAFSDVEGPRTLAVAAFDFKDTSGEVREQTAEHDARLKAFGATLEGGLSRNGTIDLVALSCEAEHCSVRDAGLADLAARARASSAHYLLIGEVHKMSTLVGWVKYAVLDLSANKPVCDRYLTYRGDTDEAWRRAAEFTARDIGTYCLP